MTHSADYGRVNWSWVRFRLSKWRCRHEWSTGDKALRERGVGNSACGKCGVWRWWPIIRTRVTASGKGDNQ